MIDLIKHYIAFTQKFPNINPNEYPEIYIRVVSKSEIRGEYAFLNALACMQSLWDDWNEWVGEHTSHVTWLPLEMIEDVLLLV